MYVWPLYTCCSKIACHVVTWLTDAGWFYGDPHIRTLDGFQYTFNGLGEYTLIQTTYDTFTLQGRTAKTLDNNGVEREATIFSAFAARDNDSDTIHIGMTNKKDGMSKIIVRYTFNQLYVSMNTGEFIFN